MLFWLFPYNSLSNAVGALYVRRYFKEEARVSAMEMVTDIRKSFLEILREIEWMDNLTRYMILEYFFKQNLILYFSNETY